MNAKSFNKDISTKEVTVNSNKYTWNTSNVKKMVFMFAGAKSFNKNISNWNTGKVVNMKGMFAGADSFNQNISTWNVCNVEDVPRGDALGTGLRGAEGWTMNKRPNFPPSDLCSGTPENTQSAVTSTSTIAPPVMIATTTSTVKLRCHYTIQYATNNQQQVIKLDLCRAITN